METAELIRLAIAVLLGTSGGGVLHWWSQRSQLKQHAKEQAEIAVANATADALAQQGTVMDRIAARNELLRNRVDSQDEQIEQLQQRLSETRDELAATRLEARELEHKIAALENRLANRDSRVAELEEENRLLKAERRKLEGRVAELEAQVRRLKQKVDTEAA